MFLGQGVGEDQELSILGDLLQTPFLKLTVHGRLDPFLGLGTAGGGPHLPGIGPEEGEVYGGIEIDRRSRPGGRSDRQGGNDQ